MGAINIIQQSLQKQSGQFWSKIGPSIPQIPINTSSYNKGFVNFCMIIGLLTTIKLSLCGLKKLKKALTPNKQLSKPQFLQRYGQGSWALIASVTDNEQYCMYLANKNINLILIDQDQNVIKKITTQIQQQKLPIHTISQIINWNKPNFNYQKFVQQLKQYDLSFLILPKIQSSKSSSSFGTHVQQIPAYQHYYLLVRYIGPVLQWRSYQSAIILPSHKNIGEIKTGCGVRQGIISALDAFMRTLNFQMKDSMDIIAARGSVEQCFKDLGKKSISE